MAKFSKSAFTDTQLFTGTGKTNPAYGMGARQLGGPQVRGREAHVQVREQNSGMIPAEDYRAAKFLPALWQDIDRNGAPYVMTGGAIVGQAGVTSGTDEIAFVHQVMPANAGVPQALAYGTLDVGLTVDVDQTISAGNFDQNVRVASAKTSTIKAAGNKPLAYTPTNVIGTAWNDVFTNQKFDEPVTMKTQWLTMFPVDDLFMYGGSLAQNSTIVEITVEDDLAKEFQLGETVTETTSGATGSFRSLVEGVMRLTKINGTAFTGAKVLTGATSTATVTGDVATVVSDGNTTDIEVDLATVGFSRAAIGYGPMTINAAGALALTGIQTGDLVMPNPCLPGKLISVSDFARIVMSEAGSGATASDATSGIPAAVVAWKNSIVSGATEDTLTVADCFAYAAEHVVGKCFKRQTRATFNGNEFVGKDISTEIMSFFGQVPELNLQGLSTDGFEADQEAARQFAMRSLLNANTADVVFINLCIK